MRRDTLVRLAGALVASAAIGACGPASAPASQPGASAQEPAAGGVLRLRVERDFWEWDVTTAGTSIPNEIALWLAQSHLLRFKTGPDIAYGDPVLEPELAERWEVSPDARTFTFHLRRGVKFAEMPPVNGREVTAADVKFSYEYSSRTGAFKDTKLPPSQGTWMFEGLESIDTPDASTVVVRFKDGFAPFINYAASKNNPILPREIYDEDGSFKDRAVGAGPFQLDMTSTQKGTRWVFKKNPTYWEPGRPYLDEVRTLVLPDTSTARAAFQTGQIDVDYTPVARDIEELRKANPDAIFREYVSPPWRIWMNSKRPPLDDFRIREAISLSLDRDGFIQTLAAGKGEWALQESDIRADLFTQDEIKSFIKYDPARARRLVAEAGYPDGVDVDTLMGSDNAESQTTLPLLQAQLRQGGINLVFRVMPYAQVATKRRERDFGIDTAVGAPRPDIDGRLMPSVFPNGGNNYQGIDDPKLTELLLAQRREPDQAKRREILRRALRYLNEHFLSIATFRTSYALYMHPNVHNYYPHPDVLNAGTPGIANVWMDH